MDFTVRGTPVRVTKGTIIIVLVCLAGITFGGYDYVQQSEAVDDAGESVTRRYELGGDDLPSAGTYYIVEKFNERASRYSRGDDWKPLEYQISVSIDEKRRLPI